MRFLALVLCFSFCIPACSPPQEVLIPDNTIYPYEEVSTLAIEHFVHRAFIDLQGREPLQSELSRYTQYLRQQALAPAAMQAFLSDLQSQILSPDGEAFQEAYFRRLYALAKGRLLDGVTEEEIAFKIEQHQRDWEKDSLNRDEVGMAQNEAIVERLLLLRQSWIAFQHDSISVNEFHARVVHNVFFDQINANTVNFIRACYDQLFLRMPTQEEMDRAYPVIEYGKAAYIFDKTVSNKTDFLQALVHSREFYEGQCRWVFRAQIGREAETSEIIPLYEAFEASGDFPALQRSIMLYSDYTRF
ncbi:MAG: hypothetical protein AAFR61_04740 [Bacteroidota bacterium]